MSGRVLVTGADGFIGSHLTEALTRNGYQVTAFSFYNSFGTHGWLDRCADDVVGHFDIVAGDIRDNDFVRQVVKRCDQICHLASLIGIPYSYYTPSGYVDTNVKGTLNVLQAARDFDISRVVHTSTSEVYGSAQSVPIDEHHPLCAQSPYAATKIAADQLAQSFFYSFKTPVITLRPFNTYGPRQSARAILPTVITQILDGQTDIQLGNLNPTRDFSFVDDTVSAFISALETNSGLGEFYNLGSNFEICIKDAVSLIEKLTGKNINITQKLDRLRPKDSEVDRLWSNNKKAIKDLGWVPKYAGFEGFESGLSKTITWFQDPINRSYYDASRYNI